MQEDMDHCAWCHPGGWGSRVTSPSKLVSSFSRSLWISSILQVPALSPTLDSLRGGLSLGSSRWNKTFPSQAALSYCLFRSTEKLTMTVSQHVIPMYFFHDILGRWRGVYLALSSIHGEVGAEYAYLSPVLCSENPAPISIPAAQNIVR